MKRILSLLTALSILMISLNIVVSAEDTTISATEESGKYTWNFVSGTAEKVYNVSDECADLRISLGKGDSISANNGLVFSGPSCKEKTDTGYTSAADTNRYIFLKPAYSGTLTMKICFGGLTGSAKGRVYYNDYGTDTSFDEIDLSKLQKGYVEHGAQVGSDIGVKTVQTLTMNIEAGHIYSLHIYVYTGGCTISEMYYESESIVGKTASPTINTPITSSDTSITGSCAENAQVKITINGGAQQTASVSGTEWTLSDLTLNEGDTISATAQVGEQKESDPTVAVVVASAELCTLTINESEHGTVTSNQADNSKIVKGSNVILTATPYGSYTLSSLTVNGETVEVDDNNQYSFNIDGDTEVSAVFAAPTYPETHVISGRVNDDTYLWLFGENEEAHGNGTYNYSDEYGEIRIGNGTNDSITKSEGIYFSGPSCKEKTDTGYTSAKETNRYILIKPTHSGALTIKARFDGLTGTAKGRFYYNDYGTDASFDDIDLAKLQKGYVDYGAQIGNDIGNGSVNTLTMAVQAGHIYSIHSYVYTGGLYLSELSYSTDEIAVMPVSLKNLSTDAEGNLHGSIKYHNITTPQAAVLIAAKYNSDGRLEGMSVFDAKQEGEIDFGAGYNISSAEQVKLFVWETLNNMKPLSRAYTESDIDFYKYNYLDGKTMYAFGDSIVYGHNAPANSFVNIVAENNNMKLNKMAVNGATILAGTGNDIITQIKNAPSEEPDFVVFDGYTNDASPEFNISDKLGDVTAANTTEFDNSTFCGSFEEILYTIKQKWHNTNVLYVTIHKSYARDWDTQCTLRDKALEICKKWNVSVADIFEDTTFDTRDEEQQKQYLIGGAGSHPNRVGYEKFYVPEVTKMLSELCGTSLE